MRNYLIKSASNSVRLLGRMAPTLTLPGCMKKLGGIKRGLSPINSAINASRAMRMSLRRNCVFVTSSIHSICHQSPRTVRLALHPPRRLLHNAGMSSSIQDILRNDSKRLGTALNLDAGSARIEVQCLLQTVLQVNRAYLL